jgi:UDP-N-acetylglucosamine 2-epimerase (non-hydrolysing)
MKIISVVGARPNFMKIAPFIRAINKHNSLICNSQSTHNKSADQQWSVSGGWHNEAVNHLLVHTGQHYDDRMSRRFFDDLNLPEADINLGIGSGSHAEQVGKTMIGFEKVLHKEKPDWVVVVGDVNATLACSVTARKEHIRCCHIEAGLRSGDMNMPEEINRLVTDRVSDLLLAPDRFSVENLKSEGIPDSRIRFVGNIMIDTLDQNLAKASELDTGIIIRDNLCKPSLSGIREPFKTDYCVVTLHRPSNVDEPERLELITEFLLNEVSSELPVIWPIHPRTAGRLAESGLIDKLSENKKIILLQPLGYLEMLRLNLGAKIMITDSGGLQEECTVLGTPFLTLRRSTERPVTLRENGGSGILTGDDPENLRVKFKNTLGKSRIPVRPELWDGNASERCVQAILDYK